MTNINFGKETEKLTKLIRKDMPALDFLIWDLTPFIPLMHNWRKNIVFIECNRVAVDSLVELVAREYPDYEVYAGIKKPILRIKLVDKKASIVIIAREGKTRREVEGNRPKLEKCLVDLLYFSKSEILPISLTDILDLWEHYLSNTDLVKFNELYRYSLRRYLGWFVSIFAYYLSKKTVLKTDERHFKSGMKNLELLKLVSA
ncbi:TPA: hypothetical protein HA238_05750 [Candidatus Micrarchaeota archaeon]|nr:hypothetical protein [Candidatus Micrarchaeota archaeon]